MLANIPCFNKKCFKKKRHCTEYWYRLFRCCFMVHVDYVLLLMSEHSQLPPLDWGPLGVPQNSGTDVSRYSTSCTPQKSNMDTPKMPCLKGVTFSKPSFWVSMLVFGGIYIYIYEIYIYDILHNMNAVCHWS